MKKFIVKVNGNSYEVEVEEVLNGVPSQPSIAPAPQVQNIEPAPRVSQTANTNAEAPSPKAAAPSTKKVAAGATTIKAPMPGTILDINVNEGDTVEKGQVLCILEAMKMENEIMSPTDGRIATVNTSTGVSVEAGDLLFSIE